MYLFLECDKLLQTTVSTTLTAVHMISISIVGVMSSEEREKTTIEFGAFNSLSLCVLWIIINTIQTIIIIILIICCIVVFRIRYDKSLPTNINTL